MIKLELLFLFTLFLLVFPTEDVISVDFNSGEHPFSIMSDSIYMEWIFVPRDTVKKSASLFGENRLSDQGWSYCGNTTFLSHLTGNGL